MESNNATKMTMTSGDVIEDSETTVEIKIKTLDSQTYTLRVNKYVPVPALKEQIATVTGVLSEQQRLICRGKVLKDDQLLSAYHVEDGHTLHLVVRQPHHSSSPSTSYMGPDITTGQPAANSAPDSARNRSNHVARSFVFETVNVDQGDIDTSWIGQILSSVMDSLGPTAGTRSTRVDLREMGSERLGRASSDGGQHPPTPTTGTAGFRFAPTVALSSQNPTVLPDSLTTLHHYLGFMRDGFRRERFGVNGRENRNNSETAGMRHNEGHGSLPSPSSLAEIVLSTRLLLMEQAAECFEHLTRQLESHTTVTDAAARINIQNTAARYAVLMQNLGSLLLELGRATGTLRMGQTAAEAFVNAGPATFISASGPNPLMVQMAPFYPGSNLGGIHMGSVNSGHNPESEALDSPFLPRNIEVRIRTVGRAVPVDTSNGGEQTGAQTQEPTDPSRNSSGPNVHQAFSAVLGGESGVRVVPYRTVVAIPGVNHSASDSPGSGVGLMYPVFTRLRQRNNTSDARTSQAFSGHYPGAPEVDRQPNSESAVQRQNVEESNTEGTMRAHQFSVNTVPLAPGMGLSASESSENQGSARVFTSSQQRLPNINGESGTAGNDGRQTGRLPMAQFLNQILSTLIPGEQVNVDAVNHPDNFTAPEQPHTSRDAEPHGTGVGNDQGVFFSNLLRQVMPLIPQGMTLQPEEPANARSSTVQTESGNDPSTSQHRRDPPESPNAKRLKREES